MHCTSKKFERMARQATDICFRVLKENNKSIGSIGTVVKNSAWIISHINVRDFCVHIFPTTFLEIAVCSNSSMRSVVFVR